MRLLLSECLSDSEAVNPSLDLILTISTVDQAPAEAANVNFPSNAATGSCRQAKNANAAREPTVSFAPTANWLQAKIARRTARALLVVTLKGLFSLRPRAARRLEAPQDSAKQELVSRVVAMSRQALRALYGRQHP